MRPLGVRTTNCKQSMVQLIGRSRLFFMSSSVCMYFQSYRHSVDHFIFSVVSKLQSLFRQAALGSECYDIFSSPLQAVQTIVFSNYFRCIARLEPLQFKPLYFPTIFDVSSHVSVLATSARSEPTAVQTIAFFKLFPFF